MGPFLTVGYCSLIHHLQGSFANTYLGGILIAVAFLNEFYQLQKSEAIVASFLAMITPSCRVVRDGTLTSIPAADLVKGDIVLVVRRLSPMRDSYLTKVISSACG